MSSGDEAPTDGDGQTGAAVTDGTVPTNGVDTYYVRRGEGPPVVFIHGMAMDHQMWEPQLSALSDEFTTIAYDVRGHGRTGGSDAVPYSVDLFADDLDVLLDGLSIEQPVVVGLSLGGCIAVAYAAAHPEKVARLVLADSFPPGPLSGSTRLLFANLRVIARLDRFVRYKRLNRLQMWIGNRLSPGIAGEGDGERVQRLMEASPTIPHDEFAKIARATAAFPTTPRDCSGVTAPTLVLYGEHVPGPLRDLTRGLPARLGSTDVTVEMVPGGGHASNLDNSAFFTDAVREFARSVDDRASAAD